MIFAPSFAEMFEQSPEVRTASKSLGDDLARQTWDALTADELPDHAIAKAVYFAMPDEHAGTVRKASGIPAAIFLSVLSDAAAETAETMNNPRLGAYDVARNAWEAFTRLAERAETVLNGRGGDLAASWDTVRRFRLQPAKIDQLTRIALLAGRMYESMRGVKRRVEDAKVMQEVKDITLGGDLERLLPVEHAQMSQGGAMGDLAAMRVLQRRALQMRVAGDRPADRGPVCVCVDESGSMSDRAGDAGGGNTWAKACLMAVTRVAHEDERMVHVVHFGTQTKATRVAPGDHTAIDDACCSFLGGGTAIGNALEATAREVDRMAKAGHVGADVIIITDGGDGDNRARLADAVKKLNLNQVKMWTVAIRAQIHAESPLRKGAEGYIYVENTKTAEKVAPLGEAAMGEGALR